jgi:hypothetical protein
LIQIKKRLLYSGASGFHCERDLLIIPYLSILCFLPQTRGCISDLGRSEDRIGEKKGKPKKGRGKEDESRRDEEKADGAGRGEHRKADGVGEDSGATDAGCDRGDSARGGERVGKEDGTRGDKPTGSREASAWANVWAVRRRDEV